jgi:two-component system response regulator AlgR
MKVMIVDDERPALTRLAGMLAENPEYELCGEASNGLEAVRMAEKVRPDIVLLDIRMPGMDGLEAARHMSGMDQPPAIIFTTAYGEHALEAFETNAVAYLLKPIRQEKLVNALAGASRPNKAQLNRLSGDSNKEKRTHICARVRGNLELIPLTDIYYFQADQKYVTVRHRHGEVLIEEPLKNLEEEFGDDFMRIHRNALVATDLVCGMDKSREGRFHVRLKGVDSSLEISRRHVAEVRSYLKSL